MYCVKKITNDLFWVGGNDRRIALFENVYPVPQGVSYNAYVLMDEKTVLLDTVDKSVSGIFFENLAHVLNGRKLDYLVVNHMEPDHCQCMDELILRYPEVKIVCNAKIVTMIKQFFTFDIDSRVIVIKEGDTLATGRHTLTFVMAPMVHWPEAMVTYDITDKILFSADAFGSFGAINGNIFADEADLTRGYMDEARRYYTNIVGKYGTQVQALLKKASGIEIEMICPLHGLVWRTNISDFIDKYVHWSTYTPESRSVLIAYASVYGNTANTADILAAKLSDLGVRNISMFDVSVTHPSYIVAEAFKCSHIVLASTTYNAGIFVNMETLVHDLVAHNLQNRTFALIENGSWAATAGKLMHNALSCLKNTSFLEETLSLKSSLKECQLNELNVLAQAIADSIAAGEPEDTTPAGTVDTKIFHKLSYGLFVLTAKDGAKDNGCIINTVTQVASSPNRISIAVNKTNYTCDMIKKTGAFNVSILSTSVPFKVFQHYGFQSGRDVDKFENVSDALRSDNGIYYVTEHVNGFISGKVISMEDCGSHILFIADITESKVLSPEPSVTYEYYHAHIKPKPQKPSEKKKGFVCKICGYVYEGETLPPDFVCPLCKHGAEDFEPLN